MGNDTHSALFPSSVLLAKGQTQLYHFGTVALYHDPLKHLEYFSMHYDFLLEADCEQQFIAKLQNQNNRCPFLVSIHKIQTNSASVCSNAARINIFFEYLPTTLQSILDHSDHPLPQLQIRLLLTNLFEAVQYINQKQTHHGDISPQFIYLDRREQRRYKIFDSSYFDPNKHGYYRAQQEKIYCAPQIMTNISERRVVPNYNHQISDTFSIGLIALYCATLICPLTAYRNKEIDYYYIEMLLRIAYRNGYSDQFMRCVEECVKLKNRPTVTMLLKEFSDLKVYFLQSKLSLRR